jgi:hypothetical protein
MGEFRIRVGESAKIKRSFFSTHTLIYAGMISDRVYSLVITYSAGHNSMAYNLYVPVSTSEIHHEKAKLLVQNVTAQEISLRIEARL